jgi:cob(I)alamin adenosyltransferase
MEGYLQVYTGNGKGKTTAAIGLAIRTAGAGLQVFFAQFVKDKQYSEIRALAQFEDRITVRQYGRGRFMTRTAEEQDIETAHEALSEIRRIISSGDFRVVILDEAAIALHYGLFTINELLNVIVPANLNCKVVITGRYAPPELIEAADLVTEMRDVKHYYTQGVHARKGIEL